MKKLILPLLIFGLFCGILYAEEYYSDNEIADSIYIIEGGLKTFYPFGIKSVYCKGYNDCRQICLNTIKNNRIRYYEYGYRQEKDFLIFLAKRYCPYDWEIWVKNLKFYLNKGRINDK